MFWHKKVTPNPVIPGIGASIRGYAGVHAEAPRHLV
jgi:hypothetical protein